MSKVVINSHQEFEQFLGKRIGESDWILVDQDRINKFADATDDHQWIHVDVERAKEGPFGQTIAHGYLSVSLLPCLWEQIAKVNNLKMMVNYGMDKLKFGKPVLSGQSVRMVVDLQSIADLRGITKVELNFCLEIQGEKKHALDGIATFLYYFER